MNLFSNSKNLKTNSGITIVTLIITIIILLILAGITMLSALDIEGVISKSKEAKFKMDIATLKEDIDVIKLQLKSDGEFSTENLENEMENNSTLKKYEHRIVGDLLIIEDEIISLTGSEIYEADKDKWYYSINEWDKVAGIYGYKGNEKNLVIPTYIRYNGKIYPITVLQQTWTEENFQNDTNIETVTILSNITKIESWVFNNCTALKKVTMEDSVTSIGDGAFNNCPLLKEVKLSNNIIEMGTSMFSQCKSLEECNIPESLTVIPKQMFDTCKALKSIVIPNSVTTIGENAFIWCTSLEEIDIPSSVKEIGNLAFGYVGNNGDTYMGEEWAGVLKRIILREGIETIGEQAFCWAETVIADLQKPTTVTSVGTEAFLHYGEVGGGNLIGW